MSSSWPRLAAGRRTRTCRSSSTSAAAAACWSAWRRATPTASPLTRAWTWWTASSASAPGLPCRCALRVPRFTGCAAVVLLLLGLGGAAGTGRAINAGFAVQVRCAVHDALGRRAARHGIPRLALAASAASLSVAPLALPHAWTLRHLAPTAHVMVRRATWTRASCLAARR